MAAIDKIYGTRQQRAQLYSWCVANRPDILRYIYAWDWDDNKVHPITNFPVWADWWLYFHCTLGFVVAAIDDQYIGAPPKPEYWREKTRSEMDAERDSWERRLRYLQAKYGHEPEHVKRAEVMG